MCEALRGDTGQCGDIGVSTQDTDMDFSTVLTTMFSLQDQGRVSPGKKKKGYSSLRFPG